MNKHVSKLVEVAELIADGKINTNMEIQLAASDIRWNAKALQQTIDIQDIALHQTDHFIVFNHGQWSIEHLVSCRPNMTDCPYHKAAQKVYGELGSPYPTGRYKMTLDHQGEEDELIRIGLDKV